MDTTSVRSARPEADEFAPFYGTYVSKVPAADIVATLRVQASEMQAWGAALTEGQGAIRYAPDKWSVRQVIGHLSDAERVFSYRAMCFARGDQTPLPAFDENAYVANAAFDDRSLASLLQEFHATRASSIALFDSLTPAELQRRGTASGKGISVRALAWITAGHVAHHRQVLKEHYGV
ncbi:MAG: DinB family protein [Gemmatimonadaceae bacterium]